MPLRLLQLGKERQNFLQGGSAVDAMAMAMAICTVNLLVDLVLNLGRFSNTGHSALEEGKTQTKLTGAGIGAIFCVFMTRVTKKICKIGQRGNAEK